MEKKQKNSSCSLLKHEDFFYMKIFNFLKNTLFSCKKLQRGNDPTFQSGKNYYYKKKKKAAVKNTECTRSACAFFLISVV